MNVKIRRRLWLRDHRIAAYSGEAATPPAKYNNASRPKTKTAQEAQRRLTLAATQGPIGIIGNVKGRKNWSIEVAVKLKVESKGIPQSNADYPALLRP